MPQNWLPGDIRDRIRDLCRVKNLKQSELAHAIGIDKSTFSRFMSGKTDKLSDTSLQRLPSTSTCPPTSCWVTPTYRIASITTSVSWG